MPTPAPITLAALSHLIGHDLAAAWLDPLNAALVYAQATGQKRRQHFLAQYLHETQGFTKLAEDMCYTTPAAVRAVFGRFFPTDASTAPYLRQPEKLGNHVYANRGGNGDEASGDGYRYRGHGLCHLTFRTTYSACGHDIGYPGIEQSPEWLLQPKFAALVGAWFWRERDCNVPADKNDLRGVTAKINGPGLAGLQSRADWLKKVRDAGA